MKSCNNLSRNSVLSTLVAALLASVALLAPLPALAQADSSSVPTLMRNGHRLPLALQMPQDVTQEVTYNPVVQPNTREVSNASTGFNVAAASIDCGSDKMLSGGGYCSSGSGLAALSISKPSGNGWHARCDNLHDGNITVTVYAVCSQ